MLSIKTYSLGLLSSPTSIIHEPVIIPLHDHGLELDTATAHLGSGPEDLDLLFTEGGGIIIIITIIVIT